jgi:hypothetical protein
VLPPPQVDSDEYNENLRWIARYKRTIEKNQRDTVLIQQVQVDIARLEARNRALAAQR